MSERIIDVGNYYWTIFMPRVLVIKILAVNGTMCDASVLCTETGEIVNQTVNRACLGDEVFWEEVEGLIGYLHRSGIAKKSPELSSFS